MFILVPVLTTSSFLYHISLGDNNISYISALVDNAGFSDGATVYLRDNPLHAISINNYIPQLEARGVDVEY
tara:strand:- start:50 stop:262 length:213 start_codon:yes stop_codon:yes gene_type:complete